MASTLPSAQQQQQPQPSAAMMNVEPPSFVVLADKVWLFRNFTAKLVLTKEWIERNHLTTSMILKAGCSAKCILESASPGDPPAKCPICPAKKHSMVTVQSSSTASFGPFTSLEYSDGSVAEFLFDKCRSYCSSSRDHLNSKVCLMIDALPGIVLISQPFALQSRLKKRRSAANANANANASAASSSSASAAYLSGVGVGVGARVGVERGLGPLAAPSAVEVEDSSSPSSSGGEMLAPEDLLLDPPPPKLVNNISSPSATASSPPAATTTTTAGSSSSSSSTACSPLELSLSASCGPAEMAIDSASFPPAPSSSSSSEVALSSSSYAATPIEGVSGVGASAAASSGKTNANTINFKLNGGARLGSTAGAIRFITCPRPEKPLVLETHVVVCIAKSNLTPEGAAYVDEHLNQLFATLGSGFIKHYMFWTPGMLYGFGHYRSIEAANKTVQLGFNYVDGSNPWGQNLQQKAAIEVVTVCHSW